MRNRITLSAFAVIAAVTVCAGAAGAQATAVQAVTPPVPPTPPAAAAADSAVKDVDPVGTYLVYLSAQGNAMTLSTKIEKKADGTYTGSVSGDGIPALPINSVKVVGKNVRLSVTAPDGTEAVILWVIEGDQIAGEWSMNGDGSKLTGKKQP